MKKILAAFTISALLMISGCGKSETSSLQIEINNTESGGYAEENSGYPYENVQSGSDYYHENELEQPEYAEFFEEKKVHRLDVNIDAGDWSAICAAPKDKEYKSADITIDGKTIEDCGFKTHGNSTLNETVKAGMTCFPFKIKFDKYTENTFMGLDELVLCNNYIDVSYARQYAGYEAFRAIGKDAPLSAFFNVYVNGELLGLYTGVEEIDDSYLERVFGSHKHNLYKADEMATLAPSMPSWSMKQKNGNDTADLKKLVKVLDETPLGEKGEIESVLDVDSALAYIAVGAVIHHCDGYGGYSAHNYCLYFNDGVFYVLPWDMDLCFYQTGWGFMPSDGAQMDIADGLTGAENIKERPLIQKLLAVDEYYETYLKYCKETLEWLKEYDESGADKLYELIGESVKNDPRGKYNLFNSEFNHTYHYGFAGYIRERVAYLENRLNELVVS